jgi:hypothetical protein
MNMHPSGDERPRRAGNPYLVAGLVIGFLGLLTVLWAAAPVLGAIGTTISDNLAGAFDWKVPAWVGKLILAGVLLTVSGFLLLVGGGRWLISALGSARRRRATAAGSPHQLTANNVSAQPYELDTDQPPYPGQELYSQQLPYEAQQLPYEAQPPYSGQPPYSRQEPHAPTQPLAPAQPPPPPPQQH